MVEEDVSPVDLNVEKLEPRLLDLRSTGERVIRIKQSGLLSIQRRLGNGADISGLGDNKGGQNERSGAAYGIQEGR